MPIGIEKTRGRASASASVWFGDGSDGSYNAGGATLTVQNKNGSYDGDMVVKQYTDFNLTGGTFTADQACRGMLILVQGDCVINGTINMNQKGPHANPTTGGASDGGTVPSAGLQFAAPGGSSSFSNFGGNVAGCGNAAVSAMSVMDSLSGNAVVGTLVRQGAAGAGRTSNHNNGNPGSNGGIGQTGGGGSGGINNNGTAGGGSYGSCWGGGSGGAGASHHTSSGSGSTWGGPGGNATGSSSHRCSGGVGNPGGNGYNIGTAVTGTGGAIIIIVGGTISGSGTITAQGINNDALGAVSAHGGASGGGNILIMSVTDSFSGSTSVSGGATTSTLNTQGGAGGNGSVQRLTVAAA